MKGNMPVKSKIKKTAKAGNDLPIHLGQTLRNGFGEVGKVVDIDDTTATLQIEGSDEKRRVALSDITSHDQDTYAGHQSPELMDALLNGSEDDML